MMLLRTGTLVSYKNIYSWLPHITALTCQEVLNSSNQGLAISWSDKISFGLKEKIMSCLTAVSCRQLFTCSKTTSVCVQFV